MARRLLILVPALLVLATLALSGRALLAGTSVASSHLSRTAHAVTPTELAPPGCGGMTLTSLASGSGSVSAPTSAPTLLIGNGLSWLYGGGGNDCLVGGFVCIGGAGVDRYVDCWITL